LKTLLKAHYDKTIDVKLKEKDKQLNEKFEACRKEYELHLENMKNKIVNLEHGNDEIKNDYCQLAAEKETIERHYENMEAKVKRNFFYTDTSKNLGPRSGPMKRPLRGLTDMNFSTVIIKK